MLSRFYNLATARNSASAVVALAVVWTLARKASANQRRRFWSFVFNIFKCRFGVWELVQKGVSIGTILVFEPDSVITCALYLEMGKNRHLLGSVLFRFYEYQGSVRFGFLSIF